MKMSARIKQTSFPLGVLLIFHFVVPHILMCLPQFFELDPETWYRTTQDYFLPKLYFVGVWVAIPLVASIVSIKRIVRDAAFDPFMILETVLAILTYLLRIKVQYVLILAASVIGVILLEFFSYIRRFETHPNLLLSGLAKNAKYLAALCFWSVNILITIQIAGTYWSMWGGYRFDLLSIFGSVMILTLIATRPGKYTVNAPLSIGGFLGTLFLYCICIFICCIGCLRPAKNYLIVGITIAFAMLLLIEIVFSTSSRKTKTPD